MLKDLQFGIRALLRNPGFTTAAVLTLALGIGGNTAIFSLLDSVLLEPLPYPQPEQLVQIFERNPEFSAERGIAYTDLNVSAHNFRDYRESNTVFSEMGWVGGTGDNGTVNLVGGDRPERVRGAMASASAFTILGVQPMLGRVWSPEEDVFSFDGTRVAILSHDLWQTRFGSDPDIVGRTITLNSWSHVVVGVMPPGFRFPPLVRGGRLNARLSDAEIFVPLDYNAFGLGRSSRQFTTLARLAPGVSVEVAQAQMSALSAGLAEAYPDVNSGWDTRVVPLRAQVKQAMGPRFMLLMIAVGLLLLIACANVASLLFVRGMGRRAEVAIRSSLGCGRWRLVRQLMTESLILASVAGIAGLLLAGAFGQLLESLVPADVPRISQATMNWRVFGFAAGVTLLTGLVFGLVPALVTSRTNLAQVMRGAGGGVGSASGVGRVVRAMVVAEVALSVILLLGSGLLTQSFFRLSRQDPGYERAHLLKLTLDVGRPNYSNTRYFDCDPESERPLLWNRCRPNQEAMTRFFTEVVRGVEELPGVESASLVSNAPLTEYSGWFPLVVPGEATELGTEAEVQAGFTDGRLVYPGYFRTMGIRLLSGREFVAGDPPGWSGVAVVNSTLARRLWPDGDALGQRFSFYGGGDWMTVIGVAADTQDSDLESLANDDGKLTSHAYHLGHYPYMDVVVRTAGAPGLMVEPIRAVVQEVDPGLPVGSVATFDQLWSLSNATPRFYALVIGILAIFAVFLCGVGLYGVVAFAAGQRQGEIGLRMALGATRGQIGALIAYGAMRAVLLGVVLGGVTCYALFQGIARFLYGMNPVDPVMFGMVAVCVALLSITASYLPARRASRLDPMEALRSE